MSNDNTQATVDGLKESVEVKPVDMQKLATAIIDAYVEHTKAQGYDQKLINVNDVVKAVSFANGQILKSLATQVADQAPIDDIHEVCCGFITVTGTCFDITTKNLAFTMVEKMAERLMRG